MSKTLKLGFAMGGGLSLGTFSGAALTEAIKLIILYGKDSNEKVYDNIEIDVFSGASAGSISLCIMLRSLAEQTQEEREHALRKLNIQFGTSTIEDLPEGKRENLIAAQVAQDAEERIWVEDVGMEMLLPDNSDSKTEYIAGVLDRRSIDDIARKNFDLKSQINDPDFKFENRRLLGKRVLFASTLTNLTAINFDARSQFNAHLSAPETLEDGLTSNSHAELRVFDLYFDKYPEETDFSNSINFGGRWCRYHLGAKTEGRVGELKDQKTWSKLVATSIACGAFPFAFEPVPLERSDYEFGNSWPDFLKEAGIKKHTFAYVDGGTLNNEPIREAFRMASFMDASDERDKSEYDRMIIFVDPNISTSQPNYTVPYLKEFDVQEPGLFGVFDGYDLIRLASLDRLATHAGSMLSTLHQESRVVEDDKIFYVQNKFEERDKYRKFLADNFKNATLTNVNFENLISHIKDKLKSNRENVMIPAGTLDIPGELKRVLREENNPKTTEQINDFLNDTNPADREDAGFWYEALNYIQIDLLLDLTGKDQQAKLIGIGPYIKQGDSFAIKDMPGQIFGGFGGFFTELAGRYEVKLARYSTWLLLKMHKSIDPPGDDPLPPEDFDKGKIIRAIKTKLPTVVSRLKKMIRQSNILPGIAESAINLFIGRAAKKMELIQSRTSKLEFRVKVPGKRFELDGNGIRSDARAQKIGEDYYVVTMAEFRWEDHDEKEWTGAHVNVKNQSIQIDKNMALSSFCSIDLPKREEVERALLLTNPVFFTEITEEDKGEHFGSDKWGAVKNYIKPLDKNFF